ncbi:GNAT family N-acetyltransferase [Bacillus timonensis]|uniref:GNAT family N-acetyltransferase n=1 Tax=Bacillus timonensis TaxID=1033734 RepID=A0A4S3PN56_9BACI|nr:GNAT family N-acetyltransferase [Bacillus timonensis]THE10555.1 GNAT family N-acetyltransferase [Bacillus timonensis]
MQQDILSTMIIKNVKSIADLQQVHKLESMVWSPEDTVPISHTAATIKNGGFILGAFYKEELIGFQYSFPGFNGKKPYLVSHSLGIHSDYRKQGIGEKLKHEQRKLAAEMGYDLISWTYDPLETVNGNLNLHKLGAVCTSYIENAYGEMTDGMNDGISTDRFVVEWSVTETNSENRNCDISASTVLIQTKFIDGCLTPGEIELEESSEALFVPVPGNFQEIKKMNFDTALQWREKTKKVFTHYLEHGWVVTDLVKDPENNGHYMYLLEK